VRKHFLFQALLQVERIEIDSEYLIVFMVPMDSMASTTITVSDSLRAELVKLAAELQLKVGRKVDYEDVIRYLISKTEKNQRLLSEACAPVKVRPETFRAELRKGRAEDRKREEMLERRYS
jgi:predicted CopG family antitoxin